MLIAFHYLILESKSIAVLDFNDFNKSIASSSFNDFNKSNTIQHLALFKQSDLQFSL
jgi:hypothetical protein